MGFVGFYGDAALRWLVLDNNQLDSRHCPGTIAIDLLSSMQVVYCDAQNGSSSGIGIGIQLSGLSFSGLSQHFI